MSRARQRQQAEEARGRILEAARRIVAEEGVGALSVRRITKEIDYSTGIIYHYFKSKEQILSLLLQEGYKRIVSSIQPPSPGLSPDEAMRASFKGYIESALKWPAEYKAVMLDSSPQVLEVTSVLDEGACERRPALSALASTLEAGIAQGLFAPCDVRLSVGAIWSAMFGLLLRLIIERQVTPEQQARLIDCQIELILKGLRP